MNSNNVFDAYLLTTKRAGISFTDAYNFWQQWDYIIIYKYEIIESYLKFTDLAGVPLEEALALWDIHIKSWLYDFV